MPALLLAPLALAACMTAPAVPPLDLAAPRFSALDFFSGETVGDGVLRVAMHAPRAVHVVGHGSVGVDGVLVLDQRVAAAGKPPAQRQWRIREVSPGRYAGTLSDASGAVSGIASPGLLQLGFRLKKSGLGAEQRLMLAPDGRSAHNIMTVRKLGMIVAVLDETIRKTS